MARVAEYPPAFFRAIREGCQRSAEAVVPLILDTYRGDESEWTVDGRLAPRPMPTVGDFGCGEGWWGKAFEDRGCRVLGIDSAESEAVIDKADADLTDSWDKRGFDIALCLEVAEHLPESAAPTLVETLVCAAPVVIFSAAIPGQGGTGHVNEQWPAYWADLFAEHGYRGSSALRWAIWEDDRVKWWYRQNLLVFAKPDDLVFAPDSCPAVIHPAMLKHQGR